MVRYAGGAMRQGPACSMQMQPSRRHRNCSTANKQRRRSASVFFWCNGGVCQRVVKTLVPHTTRQLRQDPATPDPVGQSSHSAKKKNFEVPTGKPLKKSTGTIGGPDGAEP